MNVTTYTAIIGRYDKLKTPSVISDGQRYLCFTDTPDIVKTPWQAAPLPDDIDLSDPGRAVRRLKLLAHRTVPDAEITMWVDGTYTIAVDVVGFTKWALWQHDIAAYQHFARDCVYDEADEISMLGADDPQTVRRHISRLLVAGYPAHQGLHDCSILLRRHNERTAKFNEMWLEMVQAGSRRDQLSFDFALWRNELSCRDLGPGFTRNPFIEPVRSATAYFCFDEHPQPPKMDGHKPFRPWVS